LTKLRINSLGLYFGKIEKDGLRLSIEGSQLIGNKSKKNVIKLDDNQVKEWMAGEVLEIKDYKGFVIIKHKNDFLGCGKAKEDRILNFVPKTRRL